MSKAKHQRYAVVDLFAGPGGLGEGLASVKGSKGKNPFQIVLSIEKDATAHSTLLFRSFLRQFDRGFPREYYEFMNGSSKEPDWSKLFPKQWNAAVKEALLMELGTSQTGKVLAPKLDRIRKKFAGRTVLIGGPPCQAYSLVGRARNIGKKGYVAKDDPKHFLYKEYIKILSRLKPAAFIMENVKGILSSSLEGQKIFDWILDDLSNAGGKANYQLIALCPRNQQQDGPSTKEQKHHDFVIRAEDFGVPQARHRVFVVGLRRDVFDAAEKVSIPYPKLLPVKVRTSVGDVLGTMPKLRSGLSSGSDSSEAWTSVVKDAADLLLSLQLPIKKNLVKKFRKRLGLVASEATVSLCHLPRTSARSAGISKKCPKELGAWLNDARLEALANHETRGHMRADLVRYLYASIYAEVAGVSPKAGDFPKSLAPDHKNWKSGKFADRFRVQRSNQPSSTITSHISKDGHYFIHPDPLQCRSLTVREAARLQTFPDNYFFKGNRTEQFVQVGNAVPPFLALKIGQVIFDILRRAQLNET
jgi:DNA (cytosine-5)-methyltransferase 1